MNGGPRTTFVMLILAACAAGALFRLWSQAGPDAAVEMRAQELVRVSGGQPILVLVEKQGARRLGIPVTRAEEALIESALQGARGLGNTALEALGGRVLRASIDGAASARESIVADAALLDEAGVTLEELRGRSAHSVRAEIGPAPVLGI